MDFWRSQIVSAIVGLSVALVVQVVIGNGLYWRGGIAAYSLNSLRGGF